MNNGYMPYYTPGMLPAGLSNPADIQNRIQQLQNMQQQFQPAPPTPQQPNVNWIQVAGIEGARNQIVQPGMTAWMMDNNAPLFYVKSVDGMGTATLKAFRFEEVSPDTLTAPQAAPANMDRQYVTRDEFNALLAKLGEPTQKGELADE